MTTSKPNKFWTPVIIFLIAVIVIGGTVVWARYSSSQPAEIYMPPAQELTGEIYLGGAIGNPGIYPLKAGDSIETVIQAAGGVTSGADLIQLKLYIPKVRAEDKPQKVNLNQAELWLLEALPGIGKIRAQAIIDYRQQNGSFHNINELTKLDGIGITTYEQIKHLITVAD